MIPEIGQFALILALVFALVQTVLPLAGAHFGIANWVAVAKPAARAQLLFVAISFAALTWSFLTHDFSVKYVAMNSNTALPTMYLFSAVWGAHEGSLVLWALVLAFWTGCVSVFSRSIPPVMLGRVLGVLGFVSFGFILFILVTSNPFERLVPAVVEGRDLNPLLQDFGLILHPPLLYMGYVGFAVPFAFAIAAMLGGRLDAAWARWSRPWTHVAWLFLTLGITLGSWWAYYELGWGGWWFWDPVENSSFMPWLVGTALMHSLVVTEKRGTFKAWTVLLAIFTFSLSLLGTFLVRSGVLTSVHAFASDPTRGTFILIFLSVVVGGSLLIYSWRASQIRSHVHFDLLSRETGLLLNNVFLIVTAVSVLLGTLYPIFVDALGQGKISVGPPYFNSVFIPLMAPLALLIGVGPLLRWKRDTIGRIWPKIWLVAVLSLAIGLLFPLLAMDYYDIRAAFGMILAIWVLGMTLKSLFEQIKGRGFATVSRSFWGMIFGHIGVSVFIVGITLTSIYSTEKDLRVEPGESYNLAGYDFRFDGVKEIQGKNYRASNGTLTVTKDGKFVATMEPQKREYLVQKSPMTEAAIDARLSRDLFVALGEPLGDKGAWSVRIYHKPFLRWIWLGALIMALGGLVSATDRRYRKKVAKKKTQRVSGVEAAS